MSGADDVAPQSPPRNGQGRALAGRNVTPGSAGGKIGLPGELSPARGRSAGSTARQRPVWVLRLSRAQGAPPMARSACEGRLRPALPGLRNPGALSAGSILYPVLRPLHPALLRFFTEKPSAGSLTVEDPLSIDPISLQPDNCPSCGASMRYVKGGALSWAEDLTRWIPNISERLRGYAPTLKCPDCKSVFYERRLSAAGAKLAAF